MDSDYGEEDQPQRTRRAQRVIVFSVSSVLSVVFPKPISEDNKKSLIFLARNNRITIMRSINIPE